MDFATLRADVRSVQEALSDLKDYLRSDYLSAFTERVRHVESDINLIRNEHLKTTAELRQSLAEVARKVWVISGSTSILTGLVVAIVLRATGGGG